MPSTSAFVRPLAFAVFAAFVVGACAPGAAPAGSPAAQATPAPTPLAYPERPITLIVPWAAGGDTDVPMRVVAEFVSKELGQPIVVQNVSGAGGSTGTRQFKSTAKPDGYTLLSIHEHTIINQQTGVTDYSPLDFDPIALIVTSPATLATEVSNPWNNLKELIDDAKKRPGQITIGHTFGSTTQMFTHLIMSKAGVQFRAVSYEGTAQRVTALLGKQINLGDTPLSTAVTHLKAGRLKLLGYAWDKRDSRIADVATFREQGLDIVWGTSRGWVAPKGTPPEILKKLATAIQKALQSPELKKKIEDEQGSIITFLTGAEYAAKLRAQETELARVIRETGMKSTP